MNIYEIYDIISKIYKNGIVNDAFGIHLAVPFERVLRFSELGKPPIAIDLGTGSGDSCGPLIVMASACKFLGGKAYTVDHKEYPKSKELINSFELSDVVEFLVFDDISNEAKEFFKNVEPNVIFIDTSHTYEHTKQEIDFYSKILSINGFMIFHDTNDFENTSVWKALEEFLKDNDSFILEDKRINNHGIVSIKKISGEKNGK